MRVLTVEQPGQARLAVERLADGLRALEEERAILLAERALLQAERGRNLVVARRRDHATPRTDVR
jgi:hypothetical protein